MKSLLTSLALAVALALGGCAPYASISRTQPQYGAPSRMEGSLAPAEQGLARGLSLQRRQPRVALGEFLAAAHLASQRLARAPRDLAARELYNFALARALGVIQRAALDPWHQPLRVPGPRGEIVLTRRPDPRPQWHPALYHLTPTDEYAVAGRYVGHHPRKAGLGAPLVAVGRGVNARAEADFLLPKAYYGVTAVARFQGHRCAIAFEDPLASETTTLHGHTFPLAADFTVPRAVMLAETNPKKLELARLLQPGKYAETARIARLQPYDPRKTVVLVIHGLMDSPATWAPMLNELYTQADLRQQYQFWFYSYPSGYPYPHSAAILRRELDAIRKRFPLTKKMVVIGHSMGGCISRLLITDTTDEKLWVALAGQRPAETKLSPEGRQLLTEALIFRPRPEVGRVVFISAPLRGSDLARHWLGRIGSMLVRTPATLLSVGTDALSLGTFQAGDLRLRRLPNSVDTLAPNNRFVRAVHQQPLVSGVPYHVIVGDRGQGGHRDQTAPCCSDGIVPYWSSHLPGAQSELVVPSSHSAHQNAQAIAEVKRILRLHASRP